MKSFSSKSTLGVYEYLSFHILKLNYDDRRRKNGNANVHSMGKEVLGAHKQP